jgi:ABC-type branched-subunit amino acid transport system ATPase component
VIVEHIFNIPRILELASTVWTLDGGQLTVESPQKIQNPIPKIQNPKSKIQNPLEGWLEDLVGMGGTLKEWGLAGGARLSILRSEGVNSAEVALEVENVVVYRGKRLVIGERGEDGQVKGLSFSLNKGELGVLQAPNGWGKTTLLEAVAGVIPISQGAIRLQGKPIQHLPVWERVRLGLSLLQARDNVFSSLTVREVLRVFHVTEISENLRYLLSRQLSSLSGGEKQKMLIHCSFFQKHTKIRLLDEPFSALDSFSIHKLKTTLISSLSQSCLVIAIPSYLSH